MQTCPSFHSIHSLFSDLDVLLPSAVIPLLLLFCQCGGADTIFPDQFSDLPFDAKEHLISYHTEGNGEDKVCIFASVVRKEKDPTPFSVISILVYTESDT